MQHMLMKMKLPLKHEICYAQYFAKMNSECCQASEVELFVKTVNHIKLLKAVIAKRSILGIWRGSEYASTFTNLGRVLLDDQIHYIITVFNFWIIFFYFFKVSVKYCFLSFLYLNCCELFEFFNLIIKLLVWYYNKENVITTLQKLCSLPRNLRVGNKSLMLFLKKPLCMGNLFMTLQKKRTLYKVPI